MQDVLRKVIWVCLLIIPFVALYVASGHALDVWNWGTSGLFFPFIAGKNLLFRLLVGVAFFSWVALALKNPAYRFNIKNSPLFLAYAVFMTVLLVADMTGMDASRSFWSNFERMEGLAGHLHLFAYFVVLSAMLRNVTDYSRMFKAFIASNILVLGFGFAQLVGWYGIHMSDSRLDSTLGNSAYFAIYCLMFAFILALRWSADHFSRKQWLYPLLIVLNLIALFYTGTRGAQIGFLVGAVITLGLIGLFEKGKVRNVVTGTLLVGAILVGSIFVFKESSFIQSSPSLARFASISPNDLTGMSRLSIWTISYEAWKERPLLGYGQENFSYIFADKFIPEKMWMLEAWYDRSHDVFFDWLVAAGALGLLSYLSLYVVALWLIWIRKHDMPLRERAIITGVLAAYFVHNVFVFDNLISYITFFFLLAYIGWRTGTRSDGKGGSVSDGQMMSVYLPAVTLLGLVVLYVMVLRPYLVNKNLVRGLDVNRLVQSMSVVDAIKVQKESFEKAIAYNTLGSEEAREQFLQAAVRMSQLTIPNDVPLEDKQKTEQAIRELVTAARNEVEASYGQYENNVRALSIYGMFFNGIGDGVSAERALTRAHELAPKKQLVSFDLIRAYLLQNKLNEAYVLGRETFDLAPAYGDAAKVYLLTAVYANKWQEAKSHVLESGHEMLPDPEILSALVETKQTQAAIQLLNEYKQAHPEYASQVDAYIKQLLANPSR